MISKLVERLARLEHTFRTRSSQEGPPRELVRVWLRAIGIALGGYSRPRQSVPPYLEDTFSDGFARGLGYADHDDMEPHAEMNPGDQGRRVEQARVALCERYEGSRSPRPQPERLPGALRRSRRVWCSEVA